MNDKKRSAEEFVKLLEIIDKLRADMSMGYEANQ